MSKQLAIAYKTVIISILLCGITLSTQAQNSIKGYILDSITAEPLIHAIVSVVSTDIVAGTDGKGLFSLDLPTGAHKLRIACLDYKTQTYDITSPQSYPLTYKLQVNSLSLEGVTVYGKSANNHITRTESGGDVMNMEMIRRIPAFLGEVDIIKAMQLLPGVTSTSEGSSGFSVRGGAPDQNLVLLEHAPILSTSHAMGFFPLFNNDAIEKVTIYKGDIPVEYGNRLSSILDIKLKDGDMREYNVKGGIGLLSTRISVDGPIVRDKLSFLVSGRRSYFDLFLPLAPDEMIKSTRMYFWDLSGKLTYNINHNNRLTFSSYASNDVMDLSTMGMRATYGNRLTTMAWEHKHNSKLTSELSANYIKYICGFDIESGALKMNSNIGMENAGLKYDFNYAPNENNNISFGYQGTLHMFEPGSFTQIIGGDLVTDDTGDFVDIGISTVLPRMYGIENALYIGNKQKIGSKVTLKYGLRASTFSNIGADKVFHYDTDYNVADSIHHGKGELYHTAWSLEPRLGVDYVISNKHSIVFNYSRTTQYVQLAQNSAAGLPQDRWFSSNPNIKPQAADMFTVGYFSKLHNNSWEASVELYYKNMHNVIDFKDYATLMVNEQMYGELRTGKGSAYGAEFLIKRTRGALNGWISYTLSRATRKINGVNGGRSYLAPYDRTHNLSVVLNYAINDRLDLAATWVYYTGTPYTVPVGKAEVEGLIIPIYSDRNEFRLPDYHRMDLSLTVRPKLTSKNRDRYDFNISLYNIYNQHNAWYIIYKSEDDNPRETYAEMSYLFGFIPSVTFNFYF